MKIKSALCNKCGKQTNPEGYCKECDTATVGGTGRIFIISNIILIVLIMAYIFIFLIWSWPLHGLIFTGQFAKIITLLLIVYCLIEKSFILEFIASLEFASNFSYLQNLNGSGNTEL